MFAPRVGLAQPATGVEHLKTAVLFQHKSRKSMTADLCQQAAAGGDVSLQFFFADALVRLRELNAIQSQFNRQRLQHILIGNALAFDVMRYLQTRQHVEAAAVFSDFFRRQNRPDRWRRIEYGRLIQQQAIEVVVPECLAGQAFGDDYFNGLLLDETAEFDSAPPIRAILAAEEIAEDGGGLDMLSRLQVAHYVEGKRIADEDVLQALAIELGLDGVQFAQAYQRIGEEELQRHIAASRRLLAQVGGHGFPTFVLEQDGRFEMLDAGRWLGEPDAWREHLATYTRR